MFPVSSLLPVAISTATTVASHLADTASRGISFARILAEDPSPGAVDSAGKTADPPAGSELTLPPCRAQHDALLRSIESSRTALETALTERFQQHGIDVSEPIQLEVDSSGRVLEVSGNLDRDKIEQLFESDPKLAESVRRLLRQADQYYASADSARDPDTNPKTQLILAEGQVALRPAGPNNI